MYQIKIIIKITWKKTILQKTKINVAKISANLIWKDKIK
jgi:hypothetical protein